MSNTNEPKDRLRITTNYRSNLQWSSLIWALDNEDILKKDGKLYRIVPNGISRVPVPGRKPTVTLEEVDG
jgi:hypothetical protein